MSYNVDGWALLDRDGDGVANDPKPRSEQDAVVSIVLKESPDVLALQGIGQEADIQDLLTRLRAGGLQYDFHESLYTPHSPLNLAVFSRFPITSTQAHTNDQYSMITETVPVTHGYLEVEIAASPAYSFTLFCADLKSREYHPLGQTEMRRNEARMLGNHIRHTLDQPVRPNVIVAGTFHDRSQSAALRAITGDQQDVLLDPRITDPAGDIWTWYDAENEVYRRADYLLISDTMQAELLPEESAILRGDEARLASGHRPLTATFLLRNPTQRTTALMRIR